MVKGSFKAYFKGDFIYVVFKTYSVRTPLRVV